MGIQSIVDFNNNWVDCFACILDMVKFEVNMNRILTNIKYGWCDFDLGGYKGRPSYISNLPFKVLNAYEEYLKYNHCIIEFDEELTQFCLVIWEDTLIIIDNKNGTTQSLYVNENPKEVLDELVSEIINDVRTWAEWTAVSNTEESIDRQERVIVDKITKVGLEF